jgi:N-sulfoglucosamine sulfohydrolase
MAAGASSAALLQSTPQRNVSARRPNILYIHSHDTGRYVQPYGHAVPTPNLQKLAEEGILFRKAFNAAPTCSPSRSALLTGHCPHNNGMFGLAHRGFSLNNYSEHILHTLRTAEYHSTLIGIQHLARDPKIIGYDQIVPTKTTTAEHVAPAAVQFLKAATKQPFFLDVGFFETHREFHPAGPKEDPRYCQPPAPIPDTPGTRKDIADFKASARVLDTAIGEVLTALETSGLANNTLVVCTTDHGVAFPAMKCNLQDHGMGVMLVMRGPGGFTGGKVCDAMISQLDLYPSICELTEIKPPAWLQGRSLLPVIRGEKNETNEEIFGEVTYHAAYEPKRAVRTHRWKYIRNFGDRHQPVLPNCDDGLSKDLWLEMGWKNQQVPVEHLYDLVFDPNETRNLIADNSSLGAAKEMRGRLNKWMERTNDPILKGPIKAPAGAKANDPAGISPKEPPQDVA